MIQNMMVKFSSKKERAGKEGAKKKDV